MSTVEYDNVLNDWTQRPAQYDLAQPTNNWVRLFGTIVEKNILAKIAL